MIVAAVVLIITFGSLVAAGLPLLTALIGVGIGVAGITALSGFVDLNANTPVLALMIGLAVGIDYALFIVSRYRPNWKRGEPPRSRRRGRGHRGLGRRVRRADRHHRARRAHRRRHPDPRPDGPGGLGHRRHRRPRRRHAPARRARLRRAARCSRAERGFGGHGRRPGANRADRWAAVVLLPRPSACRAVLARGRSRGWPSRRDLRLGLPNDATAAADSTQRKAYDLIAKASAPA